MDSITLNERKALLKIFKEFQTHYNANNLSKEIGKSRVGTMKILKKFQKENILQNQKIGKSTIYKINFQEETAQNLISYSLAEEANNQKRWKEEFKELSEKGTILIHGSIIKNYETAKDIDLMIITNNEEKEIKQIIKEKEKILPKKIHCIKITEEEFKSNIQNKNKAIIEIIKNSINLYHPDKYVKIIKNVTSI